LRLFNFFRSVKKHGVNPANTDRIGLLKSMYLLNIVGTSAYKPRDYTVCEAAAQPSPRERLSFSCADLVKSRGFFTSAIKDAKDIVNPHLHIVRAIVHPDWHYIISGWARA